MRIFRKANNFYKKKDEPVRNVKETMAKASSSMNDAEPAFNKEAKKRAKT
jgi:hypothetical protein